MCRLFQYVFYRETNTKLNSGNKGLRDQEAVRGQAEIQYQQLQNECKNDNIIQWNLIHCLIEL